MTHLTLRTATGCSHTSDAVCGSVIGAWHPGGPDGAKRRQQMDGLAQVLRQTLVLGGKLPVKSPDDRRRVTAYEQHAAARIRQRTASKPEACQQGTRFGVVVRLGVQQHATSALELSRLRLGSSGSSNVTAQQDSAPTTCPGTMDVAAIEEQGVRAHFLEDHGKMGGLVALLALHTERR